jgi:hypothetical protein
MEYYNDLVPGDITTVSLENTATPLANTMVVNGLMPAQTYVFTIFAHNLSNKHSPGGGLANVTVTTPDSGAPFDPLNVQAHPFIPATPTSISIMWDSAYKGGVGSGYADVTNHIVHISPEINETSAFDVGTATTITISGATPYTAYSVYVIGKNAAGKFSPGNGSTPENLVYVTSDSNAGPGDVPHVHVDSDVGFTYSTIPIAWTSADNDGGSNVAGYVVSYTS